MATTKLSTEQLKQLTGELTHKDMATLAQVVRGSDANAHVSRSHTLNRGDVSGGGKKPWKQKGTGRARVSSIRSPLWRGGGVIFGPRSNRNRKLSMTQSMRLKSLQIALHAQAKNEAIWTVDQFPVDGKTKSFNAIIPTDLNGKRILVLLSEPMAMVTRSARNVPRVEVRLANQVAARDVLVAHAVIGTAQSFDELHKRLVGATA